MTGSQLPVQSIDPSSGTVAGGTSPVVVDTVAALKALAGGVSNIVLTRGYAAVGDGGASAYRWNAGDTTADDGGLIIAPTVSGIGRWNLIHSGIVPVTSYGILPDGVTDWAVVQGTRFYAMFAAAVANNFALRWPAGLYFTSVNLDNTLSNLKCHFDEGAEFGGLFHVISSAAPPLVVISTIARSSNIVTVATTGVHGFLSGAIVQIRNVTGGTTAFNSDGFTITVTDSTHFTYAQTGADESGTVGSNSAVLEKPISGVRFTGTLVSYDRVGTINAKDLYIQRIHVKSDGTKHQLYPGTKSRGVHVYFGTWDFRCDEIIVDDCGNVNNTDAALAVDGAGCNPLQLDFKRVWIKASDCHGVYLTGGEHRIGELRVDEFVNAAVLTNTQQDSDGNAQSIQGKGVWINRVWDCHIGRLIVSQSDYGTRTAAVYHLLLDETGLTNFTGTTNRPLRIDEVLIRNAKAGSMSIVDGSYKSSNLNVVIGLLEIQVKSGNVVTAELLSVYQCTTRSRVAVDTLRFVDSNGFDCLHVYAAGRIDIRVLEAEVFHGRLAYILGPVNIEKIRGSWTGGSATNPAIELNTVNDCWIGDMELTSTGAINTPAVKIASCNRIKIGKIYTLNFRNSVNNVLLDTVGQSSIDGMNLVGDGTNGVGLGIKDVTDVNFANVNITSFSKGSTKIGGAATRSSAYNAVCVGNTTQTDVPNGTLTLIGNTTNFTL